MKKVEVLSPAGSLDICKAVIRAGADAVYLGGDMFGARAYAGNLNKEQMLEAIDFAHIRGAKIYLTVNTLLKENEINDRLTDYIKPYYEAGLDAAIVQDLGVFRTLKHNFPQLPLHASTQMTVTGSASAQMLKDMGASRIVTARELTACEIKAIHNAVDIEIESFVHGALCYCYSGQCLMSSMNGNRSGNRGRCAQSCRLAYDVYDNHKKVNSDKESYPLSPKDMCALKVLPDVIDAGVYSLKIEGRMKNVTYASEVTNIYRRYVDMYLLDGRDGYIVDERDIENLMDIYNRGGFTSGYYTQNKGRTMMSLERPNHMGTLALEVKDNTAGRVTFKALTRINPQDVFEIDSDNSFSSGDFYDVNETFIVNLPKRYPLYKGKKLYRTKNNMIARKVEEEYVNNTRNGNAELDMDLYASVGEPLKLTAGSMGFCTCVYGQVVNEAVKSSAEADKVREKLAKLGNTEFVAGKINVHINGEVFLPVAWINDIRRQAADELSRIILDSYKRHAEAADIGSGSTYRKEKIKTAAIKTLLISDIKQLQEVLDMAKTGDVIHTLYLEREIFTDEGKNLIKEAKDYGINLIAAMPHITTMQDHKKLKELISDVASTGINAYLIRSIEQAGIIGELAAGADVVTDSNIYCWNGSAYREFKEAIEKCGLNLIRITLPYELTARELRNIDADCDKELIISSDVPVMVSKQCVRKTYGLCDRAYGALTMKSVRKSDSYMVVSKCDYCYSIIYNQPRLEVEADSDIINNIAPDYVRTEYALCGESVKNNGAESVKDGFKAHLITGVE